MGNPRSCAAHRSGPGAGRGSREATDIGSWPTAGADRARRLECAAASARAWNPQSGRPHPPSRDRCCRRDEHDRERMLAWAFLGATGAPTNVFLQPEGYARSASACFMNTFMFDAELVKLLSLEHRFGGRGRMRAKAPKGRRELNKEDKLRRIKQAARKLFVANGFDDASTRQIATRAGVALGTLFLYAANKRDLLFLAVNDELEDVALRATAVVRREATFLENLLTAFRLLYEFF